MTSGDRSQNAIRFGGRGRPRQPAGVKDVLYLDLGGGKGCAFLCTESR